MVPRGVRRFLQPPASRSRRRLGIAVLVAVLGAMGFGAAWVVEGENSREELNDTARAYFRAIGAGDGDAAYALLCSEAQEATSPRDLSQLADRAGGLEVQRSSLRGSGTDGWWPWNAQSGHSGQRLEIAGGVVTRYIAVRWDGRWEVCPEPATELLGRPPRT